MIDKEKKPARFAQKRDVWMRNLLRSDLPAGAKMVGLRLALYMNERKQWAHPSYDKLGLDCGGMTARQAQTNCMILEGRTETKSGKPLNSDGLGWLKVEHKRNAGNTYWLRYWWDE